MGLEDRDMKTLYFSEQGGTLSEEGGRLVLRKNKVVMGRYSLLDVYRIVLSGYVQIRAETISYLLTNRIDIAYLSTKGAFKGRIVSAESGDGFLHMAQHDRYKSEKYRLAFAASILDAKLESQQALLQRYQRNHKEVDFRDFLERIERQRKRLPASKSIQQSMGHEGAATRAWFAGLSAMLRGELGFHGRNRRPPRDPVNAMLSFGYTLLLKEVGGLLEALGFDCHIGLLHGPARGRKSLPLDLMEEFRHSIVDRVVLAFLNRRQFTAEDFVETEEKGCRFTEEARRRFLALWEEEMRARIGQAGMTPRELFRQQVARLEYAIMAGTLYLPVRYHHRDGFVL
jgi:CRISPR-associated protein Cas1